MRIDNTLPAFSLVFALLAATAQAVAAATVVFEFSGTCTNLRATDCAAFGLDFGEAVTGGFQVEASLGQPGAVSLLNNDQYLFTFTFGNQTFTQRDARGLFAFNVSGDGASISSIAGSFRNPDGAELRTLTIITTSVVWGEFEADTFTFGIDAAGKGWKLTEDSDLFTHPVPLPPSAWLLACALLGLGAVQRARTMR